MNPDLSAEELMDAVKEGDGDAYNRLRGSNRLCVATRLQRLCDEDSVILPVLERSVWKAIWGQRASWLGSSKSAFLEFVLELASPIHNRLVREREHLIEDKRNQELVRSIQQGNDKAHLELRVRVEGKVTEWARSWCNKKTYLVDDVVQTILENLRTSIHTWRDIPGATFAAWLRVIAWRTYLAVSKSNAGGQSIPFAQADYLGAACIIEAAEVLIRALQRQRVRPRCGCRQVSRDDVIRLRYYDFPDTSLCSELDKLLDQAYSLPSVSLGEHMLNGHDQPTNTFQEVANNTGLGLGSVFQICREYNTDVRVNL